MVSFSSTLDIGKLHNHFTIPTKEKTRASSQSSTKRSPRSPPPNRLGVHPPRVTSTRALTRTNRTRELKTMQRMQSKNTRGAQILLYQIPPKQQILGRNKRGRTKEEINK